MTVSRKTRQATEYGDFQTPLDLARTVCGLIARRHVKPASIIEPTCGVGTFVQAAAEAFPKAKRVLGIEINAAYVEQAKALVAGLKNVKIRQGDFFTTDCGRLLSEGHEPILVVGNPPWVTNAALGCLGSVNLPEKSNFQGRTGFDAITGKANFDISEWMLIKLLEALNGRQATLAMLCKTAVARKALFHVWKEGISLARSAIYPIDATQAFGAAVDACLLVCDLTKGGCNSDCEVFWDLTNADKAGTIGYRDGIVVANVESYARLKHLRGNSPYQWRSGVKHDCSKVMELWVEGKTFRNGLGDVLQLEMDYLYPMLKTSEIANGSTGNPTRWMLVTQKFTGDDTATIEAKAPRTWSYLLHHAKALDGRRSSIYRKRCRFSVFGVGDYAFASWKVAISGFYKKLAFAVIGPYGGKPIVLDDASYFLPCENEKQARLIHSLLSSDVAKDFYSAFIFWDSKRPITVDVLRQLDLAALARESGIADKLANAPRQRYAFPDFP